MTHLVRPLCSDDIDALQRIDQAAHGQQWSQRTFRDQIAGDDRLHLVVEQREVIVAHGALWFDGAQARVTNVAVAAERQREGLGAFVLGHLCEHARVHPHVTSLTLEVASTNLPAQALYRRFGFAPAGIDRSFYGPGKDALVMTVHDLDDPAWLRRLEAPRLSANDRSQGAVA